MPHQALFFNLSVRWNVRKLPEVSVLRDRTRHRDQDRPGKGVLILTWFLRQGDSPWVEGKGKQRQEDRRARQKQG
jgi:hypothetical protein